MFNERNGLHLFTAFGVDVFISFWYLILMAFVIFSPGFDAGAGEGTRAILHGLLFAVAITIALLVHEYGHAAVAKSQDLAPSILLHGFGGLCMHRPAKSDGEDAKVLFAGPGAGLLLGAAFVAGLAGFEAAAGRTLTAAHPTLGAFATYSVWVNIVWSLANLLLPIWPLDGGKLFHLLLRRFTTEARARDVALKISLATAVLAGAAVVAYTFSLFLALLGFFLVMNNVNLLQSGRPLVDRPATHNEPSDFQTELLDEARAAMQKGNWDEAYRLCHQLRASGGHLTEEMLDEIWEILAVSATRLEKFDEAESYLERAPETGRTREAEQQWRDATDRRRT